MTPHEVEVPWPLLRQIVREWAGSDAELEQVTPLAGGCINTTLGLQTRDGTRAVLKITPHRVDRSYADEAHQLDLLRELGVPTPKVYLCRSGSLEQPFSFLLMEFVEGVDLTAARALCTSAEFEDVQAHLAELVLAVHRHCSTHYQRVAAAETRAFEKWHDCFRDSFGPIWREIERSGELSIKSRKVVAKVHDRLDRLLAHEDVPRLVHWDLWATNILARRGPDGHWRVAALLDPACKYAHAEAEIAYLELFHTVTPTFMRAYQQGIKLPPEYHRVRKPVYHLYSLLDHLHLFGPEYTKAVTEAIERVAALV